MGEKVSFSVPLKVRISDAVRDIIPHRYHEVWYDDKPPYPGPVKENYKDGKMIGGSALSCTTPEVGVHKWELTNPYYDPTFARGKCRIIGGGDYKLVIVDQDGLGDKVYKSYASFEDDKYGREKAYFTADKLCKILQVAREIAPDYILPSKIVVDKAANNFYRVWEIQQRAVVIPLTFFHPKVAERLDREARNVAVYGTQAWKKELLKRKISLPSTYSDDKHEITDSVGFNEIWWDTVTSHPVSLDYIDSIDSSSFAMARQRFS